jgi:hypothetical protein
MNNKRKMKKKIPPLREKFGEHVHKFPSKLYFYSHVLIGSKSLRRGVVAHIYHLGIKGLRQEDCKFEASMDYMARCFLKKMKEKKN